MSIRRIFERLFGARQSGISATGVAVAVGRDVIESIVYVGLDESAVGRKIAESQAPVVERLTALAEKIACEKGIEAAPLRAVLAKLGEAGFADDEIPDLLDRKADELLALKDRLIIGTQSGLQQNPFREAYVCVTCCCS